MAFDWQGVRLVVFDVDGTLYRQRGLRLAMLRMLVADVIGTRSLQTFRILSLYRSHREVLADDRVRDFESKLIAHVAEQTRTSAAIVAATVAEWIETRPLPHLKPHVIAGAAGLFAGIRRSGRQVAALSDYPAQAKLDAMGLGADFVVSAADVGIMKPDPTGLLAVIARAGATPATTVMIGDRAERDGEAARQAGVRALIRSSRPVAGYQSFADFNDPLFAPLHTA